MCRKRFAAARIGPVIVTLAFLVSMLPSSSGAADPSFGTVLSLDSPDVAVELRNLGSSAICYIDADGNNAYGAGEPVVLRTNGGCSGNTVGNDVRLVVWDGLEPGRRLGAARDANKPVSAPLSSASFWYFDADGDNRMGAGDSVYANLVNPSRGFVDTGDVRVSPFKDIAAGTAVRGGEADLGLQLRFLAAPGTAVGYVDTNDNGQFDSIDTLYLNSDLGGSELVEFGDLRLMPIDGSRPFGSFVEPGDPDGAALYTGLTRMPCGTDVDGSGGYSPGDGLYVDIDSSCDGSVSPGDVRLIAVEGSAAGSRVASGDADAGAAFFAVQQAELGYRDIDGDGRQGPDDVYYIDLVSVGSRRIDRGDVQLTPLAGAGSRVLEDGNPDIGDSLTTIGTFASALAFLSTSGGTNPSAIDAIYLNVDLQGGEGVEPGDVRLVPIRGLPFGGSASLATGEVLPRIMGRGASVCISSSDNVAYKAGDAVYLSFVGCSEIRKGNIRLVPLDRFSAGSIVAATDPDIGGRLTSPSGQNLDFFDADGDGEWSFGDTLYADLVSPADDRVDVGDVRLTSMGALTAGSTVRAGDNDLSLSLKLLGPVGSRTSYVDGNNDGTFGASDIAYIDMDGTGIYVTILDVRLVPLPEVKTVEPEPKLTETETTEPQTPVTTTTTTTTTIPTQSLTDTTDSPTGQPGPTGAPTPGIGTVVSLLALLGIVVLARRRYEV